MFERVDSVFLQFDGVRDNIYRKIRGRPLLKKKMAAIANCARAGLGVILVPTVVKAVNTDDLGAAADRSRVYAALVRHDPHAFAEWGRDIVNYRPPGGESFADCSARVRGAFETIIGLPHVNIAIVAHAGVNRLLLCHVLVMPLHNLFRIAQDHACVNIISCGDSGCRVRVLNYTEGAMTGG